MGGIMKRIGITMMSVTLVLFLMIGLLPPAHAATNAALNFETRKTKAEQGYAEAQYALGYMYDKGQGVPQDYKKAVVWYTKAAEQGYAKAQNKLGLMYFLGMGVSQDYKRAVFWYTKAAKQGVAEAQNNLGLMYFLGMGVSQDYKRAVFWYTKAAKQGVAEAQNNLGSMYALRIGVSQDYKRAVFWYTKAAKQGVAEAQYNLGLIYYKGQGVVAQDYQKAVTWYTTAAEQGYAKAQCNLGVMYLLGKGVAQDYKKAAIWCTKPAEQGDKGAQYILGLMYAYGQGVPQDYKLAYVWWSLSAASGDAAAVKNRNIISERLPPQALSEAQELAARMQAGIDKKKNSSATAPDAAGARPGSHPAESSAVKGTGTGFIITGNGYILTCWHVIEGAGHIKAAVGDTMYQARIIREDKNNDLALLKISGRFSPLAFAPERTAKMGQETFTIGFPNPELQGVGPKLTKGDISSLTGVQDDVRLYQISIPVQPGNSGGPLLDNHGNVIGIIVAMLNAATAFKFSGSLPQNVNYAIKSLYAQALVDTVPEAANNLPNPAKNESFDRMVNRVVKGVVMIVSYE